VTLADFDPGHNTGSTGFPILTSPVDLTSHPPVRFILSVYSTPYLLIPRLFFLAAATAAAFCVFFFCCCWRLCKLCCLHYPCAHHSTHTLHVLRIYIHIWYIYQCTQFHPRTLFHFQTVPIQVISIFIIVCISTPTLIELLTHF